MKPSEVAEALNRIATAITNSKNPDKRLVARDLKKVLAGIPMAPPGPDPDMAHIEEILYADQDLSGGSSIWWLVFQDLGMKDWTPLTDFNVVENRAKELLSEWSAAGNYNNPTKELAALKANWVNYRNHYMPEHIELLRANGYDI